MKPIFPPFSIGERVRLLRLFAGMSQIHLAEIMQISQAWLSRAESDEYEFTASQILKFKVVFEISADTLLDGLLPFSEINIKFKSKPALQQRFTENASIMLKDLYPLIKILSKFLPEPLESILLRERIKWFAFCDPSILVNGKFFRRFAADETVKQFFQEQRYLELLNEEILISGGKDHFAELLKITEYNKIYRAKWFTLMKKHPMR